MKWLTTTEVAEAIQETPEHVSRRCARGDIAATKLGRSWRITEKALEAFMVVNNTAAAPGAGARSTVTSRVGSR